MRIVKFTTWALAWLAAFICAAWAFGALYFDFPKARAPAAILFVIVLIAAAIFLRGKLLKLGIIFAACALVASWWLTLKPSNNRPWQPDVAQTAWAEINGDEVTAHNIRNCDYRTDTDFTTRWETRTVRLSQITGMDIYIMYWGSPWLAHPIVSFRFADALYWLGNRDKTGAFLDGGKTYKLTVPLPVPGGLFWSVTAYDAASRSEVQSDQDKAALRSLFEWKNLGDAKSVDLYFGPTAPQGQESRWIKTSPGKGWFTYFRIYGPEQPAFDGS